MVLSIGSRKISLLEAVHPVSAGPETGIYTPPHAWKPSVYFSQWVSQHLGQNWVKDV